MMAYWWLRWSFFSPRIYWFLLIAVIGEKWVIVIVADFGPRCMFWGVESNPEHKILQEIQSKGWSYHVCCRATSGVISWDVLFWAPHVSLSEVGIPQNESLDRKNMETHMINTVFEGSPFSQKLVFDLGIPKASSWGSFHIRYNPKRRTLDAHCNCKCFITMASFSLSILSIFPGQSFLVLIHTFNFVGNF